MEEVRYAAVRSFPIVSNISRLTWFYDRFRGSSAQRSEEVGSQGCEDKDLRTSRTQVLNMDWGVYLGWFEYIQKGPVFRQFRVSFVDCLSLDVGFGRRISGRSGYHPQEVRVLKMREPLFLLLLLFSRRAIVLALGYPHVISITPSPTQVIIKWRI